jgi:hypothetical protein
MAAQSLLDLARAAEHRFWPKVDKRGPDECWPWTAGTDGFGYGRLQIGSRSDGARLNARAHRLSWCLANGRDIPPGLLVLHRCDNPPCCNPLDPFLGTDADNVADRGAKGRAAKTWGEANPNAVLNNYAARIACRMAVSGKWKLREIAAAFRISMQQVCNIKRGRQWASATADIRARRLVNGGSHGLDRFSAAWRAGSEAIA